MEMAATLLLSVVLVTLKPMVGEIENHQQDELDGCLDEGSVQAHVKELATADWRLLDRTWVAHRWPNQLDFSAREPGSNEVLGFDQRGRVINREVQCGISYLFAGNGAGSAVEGATQSSKSKDAYYLRTVSLRQAARSQERQITLAHWIIVAIGAPPSAAGTWSAQFDSDDTRPVVFKAEYAWPSSKYRQHLLVRVLKSRDVFILDVDWTAEIR